MRFRWWHITTIGCFSAGIFANALASPVSYRLEIRSEPRPQRIHVLQIDLADKSNELAVEAGESPDEAGPAEAQLVDPLELSRKGRLIAAINGNAWANLPATAGDAAPTAYLAGCPCNVLCWAGCCVTVLKKVCRKNRFGVFGWMKKGQGISAA